MLRWNNNNIITIKSNYNKDEAIITDHNVDSIRSLYGEWTSFNYSLCLILYLILLDLSLIGWWSLL